MDALERLVALEEIRSVIQRYAIAFDDHDWGALATLWTEDAAFVAAGEAFEGREVLLEFLSTCLPDDYHGKHFCAPPLIELAPDGLSASARTDVVWIPQNFETTIVARYNDELVREDGRWLIRRRVEVPVPYKPGPPPQSETALAISGPTMRVSGT
jgi:uncharacterized protein (TIGR02246 family)